MEAPADLAAPDDLPTPEGQADAPKLTIDPAALRLRLDDRGRLLLLRDGHEPLPIVARRAFPWSRPGQFVSLRSKEGTELALLETLDAVPAEARATILAALDAATFVPKIRRVSRVDMQHGYQLWDVETDAGPVQLRVQEREDIRFLSESRFSVKDAHGNVYEIADIEKLDDESRRELARVI